jgi:hypothetical protein
VAYTSPLKGQAFEKKIKKKKKKKKKRVMWDQEDPRKVCPIYSSLIPKYLARFNTNYIICRKFMDFFLSGVNENRE